jgi:hypothetical protein
VKDWFKWYGAVVVLGVLWVVSILIFHSSTQDVVAGEAGATAHFWAGLSANLQAEWAHLLFSTAILVGFGRACFRRGYQDVDRIEGKLDELLRHVRPDDSAPGTGADVNLGALGSKNRRGERPT